ncbi:MAG: DUF3175 domain-containing protein [Terriglobia bacterium]
MALAKQRSARKKSRKNWSGEVTRTSNALDLDPGVFTWTDPKRIAKSLSQSAERSSRRKGTPLQSAMSMLNFYINRAGGNLKPEQNRTLERAKEELRRVFEKKQ